MVCTSFYILYPTYNKQGGLARLFSRVFIFFFSICICARRFTILYINTHGLEYLGGVGYILFGVQTYYFFTFRAPDLSGINFIFIYKVQRLEKIEFMIFLFCSSLIKSCKKKRFSLLDGKMPKRI